MKKDIKQILPKKPLINQRKRVAAYARVSMETDRLQHSLSAQISYYSEFIQNNPEWEFKGVFSDNGISGTSTSKRPGFTEMLEECDKGNIDIILTKSIKRFARNTVDLLEVVRHLKSKGIEVRFENERINSMSGDGELMLTILASFAQEESRSISDNVKWGIRKRFEKGLPVTKSPIFGYSWVGDTLEIVEEEAQVVKRIYEAYLAGKSRLQIGKMLEADGIKTRLGNSWRDSNIKHVLTNITYTGNLLFQKEFVVDPISKQRKLNKGELPQYFVEDTHEAIIPKEMFDAVQAELERRKLAGAIGNPAIPTTELTGKIHCPYCGKNFQRTTLNWKSGKVHYWSCANRKAGRPWSCGTGDVNERIIHSIICEALELEHYDARAFADKVDHIDVIKKETFIFYLKDGFVKEVPYRKVDRREYFTDEVKARISEQRKDKHQYKRKHSATPFTGLIRCDKCGECFGSQNRHLQNGEYLRYLSCRTPSAICPNNTIKEPILKELTCDVLELDEFDETVMDDRIERIFIADQRVRFLFKDGHEEIRTYEKKKSGVPWTKDRREKQLLKIKEYWQDEDNRRKASERMKQVRSEKQWAQRK